MRKIFLETSALLQVVFHDEHERAVQKIIRGASRIVASRLLKVESERALIRAQIENPKIESAVPAAEAVLRTIWPRIDFIEMTKEICNSAGQIAPRSRLRTLDAIHLASFYSIRRLVSDIELISYDKRILDEVR